MQLSVKCVSGTLTECTTHTSSPSHFNIYDVCSLARSYSHFDPRRLLHALRSVTPSLPHSDQHSVHTLSILRRVTQVTTVTHRTIPSRWATAFPWLHEFCVVGSGQFIHTSQIIHTSCHRNIFNLLTLLGPPGPSGVQGGDVGRGLLLPL